MSKSPIRQRTLSLLLSIALILSIFGVNTVGAYAAQNGTLTVLYLENGDIVIDGASVTQGGHPVTRGAQDSGYLITQTDIGTPTQHGVTVESGTQYIKIDQGKMP